MSFKPYDVVCAFLPETEDEALLDAIKADFGTSDYSEMEPRDEREERLLALLMRTSTRYARVVQGINFALHLGDPQALPSVLEDILEGELLVGTMEDPG